MNGTAATVFLSYAHADKPLARLLRDGLQEAGCRVWVGEGALKVAMTGEVSEHRLTKHAYHARGQPSGEHSLK